MKLNFYFHRRLLLHVTMSQMRAEIGISNFECPPSQSSSIFTRTRSPFFWLFVTEVSLHADSYYYYCSLVTNLAFVLYRTIAFHCSSPLNAQIVFERTYSLSSSCFLLPSNYLANRHICLRLSGCCYSRQDGIILTYETIF